MKIENNPLYVNKNIDKNCIKYLSIIIIGILLLIGSIVLIIFLSTYKL